MSPTLHEINFCYFSQRQLTVQKADTQCKIYCLSLKASDIGAL
jgi:hypothetical protein